MKLSQRILAQVHERRRREGITRRRHARIMNKSEHEQYMDELCEYERRLNTPRPPTKRQRRMAWLLPTILLGGYALFVIVRILTA